MALSELWRFDAPPQSRVKVTRDGFGVLLRQPTGATLYPFAPKAPQQLPLRSDARGMERGEVSWSTDGSYLASTGLEGKLQLLQNEEKGYVEVALLEHGFRCMPQLCWSPSVQHLALWQRQERSWRLWRGSDAVLQTLEETSPVKGIAWCPHWPLLAVWYCFGCEASKSLHLWSTESLQEVHLAFEGRQVCDVAWSPHLDTDGATAAVLQDGQVILCYVRTEMQLETSVLQKLPPFGQPSIDSWEVQWSPEGTGTRLVLQPWRQLRVSGALHNNAVAELRFTVTPKNAQEKVLPAGSLAAWPSPKIWRQQWTEIALEGFALTIHGWSPDGRCLLVLAHALSAAVGHVKRCRVQLWSTEEGFPVVPVMEISTLEDCPLHRLRLMEGGLLGAAVDGTARLISLEESAPQHIILGDAWNAAAPTGASWRNWPRGAIDARILPCHRIAVTLRHRQMAGDCEEGDAVVVFGRHFEGSNFRRLLMGRNVADVPRDEDAALKSLGRFLSHLELDATRTLDLARQRAARYLDHVQNMLGESSPAHFKSQVEAAAAWCSPEDPSLQPLINDAVEADDGDLLKSLVHFFLSLHAWHHALRSPLLPSAPWEEGRLQLCCVAEALDESWRPFMREGSTYRLPSFTSLTPRGLSTSTVAPMEDGVPQTRWYLDVEGTSINDASPPLLYIDAELAGGGGLWMLPPYCVVEVVSAKLTGGVDCITLRLPGDSVSRVDLPIGPPMHRAWRPGR